MYLINQNGWIEVICGSMFSGKSEELIRRVRRTQFANNMQLYLNHVLIIDIVKKMLYHITD